MAEEQKIGGYQCEFVDETPEELVCKECKLVARKPHMAGCCVVRFCQVCIDPILKDKKPCPSCGEADFSTLFTKGDQRKILALQVYCTMKKRGCEWVGQLEQLDAHLDTKCQYVNVECPSKCDQKVQKRNLATHLEEDCSKREYRCPYCNFKATFEIVSDIHWPECLYYPVRCPNQCGVTDERETMEEHKLFCHLQEVECELSYAGCKEKFLRQDQDEHMEQNTQKHLSLMATATLKISQKLQEKDQQIRELQENHKQVQQQLQEKDTKMKTRDDELKLKLEEKDQQMRAVEEKLQKELQERDQKHATEVMALKIQLKEQINKVKIESCILPYEFALHNFEEMKKAEQPINEFLIPFPSYTKYFYTKYQEHQFNVGIWPQGYGLGEGTHVSVHVSMATYDKECKQATITFTLQLLNQHRDQNHVTVTDSFEYKSDILDADVSSLDTFIPHAELDWNAQKQTQYLKDDCLQFRITKIHVEQIEQIEQIDMDIYVATPLDVPFASDDSDDLDFLGNMM